MAILNLNKLKLNKFAKLKSFQTPIEDGQWISFMVEKPKPIKDTTKVEKKVKKKTKAKSKPEVGDLKLKNLLTDETISFSNVSDYALSRNGQSVSFITQTQDSLSEAKVSILNFENKNVNDVFQNKGLAKKLNISSSGDKLAFIFSADTSKQKRYHLLYFDTTLEKSKVISNAY